jgi:hypothetical protein
VTPSFFNALFLVFSYQAPIYDAWFFLDINSSINYDSTVPITNGMPLACTRAGRLAEQVETGRSCRFLRGQHGTGVAKQTEICAGFIEVRATTFTP